MPINLDLNVDPYFDDFDNEKQYYKVLFKPAYAVQARELTQLQTTLQNQIEEFGGSTYKEGSIIKGCNFTELSDLKYVKLTDEIGFDPLSYVGFTETVNISGTDYQQDVSFEIEGEASGVRAIIIAANRGFETRNPDLNTFYIRYITTSQGNKVFQTGEDLTIYKIETVEVSNTTQRTETTVKTINVTTLAGAVGDSFGLKTSPGIIYQKGHFLYSEEQLAIVSKYTNIPNNVSVGFVTEESVVNAFQDSTLFDNANGSSNQNAPGADRLKLRPVLTSLPTSDADSDTTFFTLTRYLNGNAVQVRDVPEFNAIGREIARRTYEESGDYIVNDFYPTVVRRDGNLKASIGKGIAYVKGERVENRAEFFLDIDDITEFESRENQGVSFDYGGYLNIDTSAGSQGTFTLDTLEQVDLQDGTGSNIGTARVRSITDEKLFLFDVRMSANTLSDVQRVAGSAGYASISFGSTIQENTKTAMVFDTGTINLRSTSDRIIPVREERALTGQSNTSVVLSAAVGEDFNVNNTDILYLDSSNQPIEVTDATVSGGGSTLTLTLATSTTAAATVYLNKNISSAAPFTKADDTLYVKVSYSSSNTKYNLGFPDVYEIVSITDANLRDVTNSFKLRNNQKDNYYDHSYIEYIPGSVVPETGLLTVTMKAFKLNDTTGNYFFTVDSYPAGVDKSSVQPFVSKGQTYNLPDCFDFRPYVEPVSPANYTNAAALGTAPTVSASSVDEDPVFSASYSILTPAHNEFATLDYEFFLNRTDSVVLDTLGNISIIKGAPEKNSTPTPAAANQLKIADIFIPAPGALTPQEAANQGRPKYGIRLTRKGVQGYTMKEISDLEKRVDNLQYYVLLNTLELDTKTLKITDANGNDRFKNGIIVDPFNDLNIADTDSAEFSAGFDFTERSLTPSVKTFPLNLKYKSASSATIFPDTTIAQSATISRNSDVSLINQRYATEFRNCASNFYNYAGQGQLVPEFDVAYDVVNNPNNNGDNIPWISDLSNGSLQETAPLTSTSVDVIESGIGQRVFGETGVNGTPQGDFVSNFTFEPFIRGREVIVYVTGLRPNTQHYFFFDQADVNANVAPAQGDAPNTTTRNGGFGDSVTSDDNGTLIAIFAIPEATFYVGQRILEVADVDTYDTIESAGTSGAAIEYNSYNFSIETNTAPRPRTRTRTIFDNGGGGDNEGGNVGDPIAQTFFVKEGMGQGSNSVFISKLDVYFKRKSSNLGVTVELRETVNGYPSSEVLPFSSVHLNQSDVTTSDDASATTTVTFPSPIRLDVNKEYAFVVIPDANNPDYLIFTSKVGGKDLTPGDTQGLSVVQDWGDGVLFTSTNNRAWKSYQDEDIKFNLYRHNFNASSGSVTLTNDDHEFLTANTVSGTFKQGEIVYKLFDSDAATSNTVSVVTGSNEITGTGMSSTYSAGDYILFSDGGANTQIFKVESANSTVVVADRSASFTDSGDGNPIALGTVSHYDFRYPDFIILEGSNASSTRKFEAGDDITGFDSEASINIGSVDNIELSYIQPMVMRTSDSVTRSSLSGEFVDPNNPTTTYSQNMTWKDKTTFGSTGAVVYSKSNDITRSKGLNLSVDMTNDSNVTSSPIVDIESSSVLAYQWKITNTADTTSKYISKTVNLAENLDAEDFELFTTAYRPIGTDVKIYIRPQAAEDPGAFESNPWVELELYSGNSVYSSISNIYDFKEFSYRLPASAKDGNDVLTYTNDVGDFTGYRSFAIKIVLLSPDIFKAPRLLDYRGVALT